MNLFHDDFPCDVHVKFTPTFINLSAISCFSVHSRSHNGCCAIVITIALLTLCQACDRSSMQDTATFGKILIFCLCWVLQRGDTGDKNANAKQKWFEEKQKRKHAELERLGLDKSDMHRIETAEQVRISDTTDPVLSSACSVAPAAGAAVCHL